MPVRPALTELRPRRIALIKPSALGDIVHALPVLTALRRRFPEAHLTWVVNRSFAPLLEGHPDLDAVLSFDRGAVRRGPLSALGHALAFGAELRRQRFDLVLDLQGLLRSGLMALATGAPRRVGAATAREGATWAYTDRVAVPDHRGEHAVRRYWRLAEALGAEGPLRFHLPVAPEARTWADEALAGFPRPWYALAVGARWQTKRWPPGHFGDLVARAQATFGGTAVFVGVPEDAADSAATRVHLVGPSLDLCGRTTLPRLVGVLARADVVVANDTGPLHLAVALGRPVVAPYTCTRANLTGPFAVSGAVETTVWCRGSLVKRCARMECMAELVPDRLWPVLREVLRSWGTDRRPA